MLIDSEKQMTRVFEKYKRDFRKLTDNKRTLEMMTLDFQHEID